MELLAATHWVARRGGPASGGVPAADAGEAVAQIHTWNPRKQQVFKPGHIRTAWDQLAQQGWLSETSI